jgi:hypothetical protein
MKSINHRQSPRIDVRLKCQVSSPGLCHRRPMLTENISRSGLLVLWKSEENTVLPQVGQLVTVDIELPAHSGFGRKCIHCQAEVVRVTVAGSEPPRVALSVNYMKFRAYRENISALEKLDQSGVGLWTS